MTAVPGGGQQEVTHPSRSLQSRRQELAGCSATVGGPHTQKQSRGFLVTDWWQLSGGDRQAPQQEHRALGPQPLGSGLLAGGEGTAGPALTACCPLVPGVQEKLGVMNKGVVYALWGYEAQNSDELSFHEGDAITILRRKDESETEWWWARLGDREGYVPKNLLGVSTGSSRLGVPRCYPCPTGPESTEPAGDPLSALSATWGNGEVP